MNLIPVDRVSLAHAHEVATLLQRAGLHPEYDDRPPLAVKGASFATTTILVPEDEAPHARQVLSEHYAASQRRIDRLTRQVWRGLAIPVSLVAAIVLFTIVMGEPALGLVMAFIAMLLILRWWSRRTTPPS